MPRQTSASKFAWIQKRHEIPWCRVWNLDETAVQLMPANKNEMCASVKTFGTTHSNITFTLMQEEGESQKTVLFGLVLKKNIASWLELSLHELSTKEAVYEKAWRHLRVSDSDRAAIEEKSIRGTQSETIVWSVQKRSRA